MLKSSTWWAKQVSTFIGCNSERTYSTWFVNEKVKVSDFIWVYKASNHLIIAVWKGKKIKENLKIHAVLNCKNSIASTIINMQIKMTFNKFETSDIVHWKILYIFIQALKLWFCWSDNMEKVKGKKSLVNCLQPSIHLLISLQAEHQIEFSSRPSQDYKSRQLKIVCFNASCCPIDAHARYFFTGGKEASAVLWECTEFALDFAFIQQWEFTDKQRSIWHEAQHTCVFLDERWFPI